MLNLAVIAPQRPARTTLLRGIWPGLLLTGGLTAAALALRQLPGIGVLSPMILAIVLGIAVRATIGVPAAAQPGIAWSMRPLLRIAIVLLGLQLTAAQVAEVGATGVAIIAATLIATFLFTKRLARSLGVEPRLAELIAAGTSICGASAVMATNTVTEGRDEDVAYAVACVTLFGTASMVLYPLLPGLLHLDARAYGLWTGASIHEIAQVVAAAFQGGRDAGEFGTVAKLTRVMMLAPMVLALGWRAARRTDRRAAAKPAPQPWFVLGFIALVGVNSVVALDPVWRGWIVQLTTVLLSMALAAMGLETHLAKLRAEGWRPLALGAAAWLFIAGFSLVLVELAA